MGKFNPKNWSSSDWLKFGTEVDCYILISILMLVNLKFSKLTKIWYRGILLYTYYDFNVYFFKILFIHIFGQIWSKNLKFFKLTEICYRGRLTYAYFDFNVYFYKIFVIHIPLGKFGTKTWSSSNWLKCCILMFIFSKF